MSVESIQMTSTAGLLIAGGFSLLGAIVAGVFTNYDKIFRKHKFVTAQVIGYTPTGNFATEFRYFMEVSGARAQIDDIQKRFLEAREQQLLAENPEDGAKIDQISEMIQECVPPLEDFLEILIPIWNKFYTLEQIQELNKFYSTKTMQDFANKSPFVNEEYVPKMMELVTRYEARIEKRLAEIDA